MLLHNKTFWIATILFLGIGLAIIWFLLPPALKSVSEQKQKISGLDQEVANLERQVAAIESLNSHRSDVASLHEKANQALPVQHKPEILLLQLDGLLASLGLGGASVTVPLSTSPTIKSSAPAPATDGEVKAGGSGSTAQATTAGKKAATTFTISGDMDFSKAQELLSSLMTFIRWNQVTAFDLTSSGDVTTFSVTAKVFTKPASTESFSGQESFLAQAQTAFEEFSSYATTPNVSTEGNYGRSDPFAQIR